jgi:hypothetical protein
MLRYRVYNFFFIYGTADQFSSRPPICWKFRIFMDFLVGLLGWGFDSSDSLYLHRIHKQKGQRRASMSGVRFKPTVLVSRQQRTARDFHYMATVISNVYQ